VLQAKVVEKIKTHIFIWNRVFPRKLCHVWDIVELDRPQMTIGRMRIACWTTKATNSHPGYVTLIALRRDRWLANAPQYYVQCFILALDMFFHLFLSLSVSPIQYRLMGLCHNSDIQLAICYRRATVIWFIQRQTSLLLILHFSPYLCNVINRWDDQTL